MMSSTAAISVLCVDDNEQVARALQVKFSLVGGMVWAGWLPSADELVETAEQSCPDIILLDLDMPGRNPFEALEELVGKCVSSRTIVFSGHVRRDLIERAIEAGAWGYVSKSDGENALVTAIQSVAAGQFALSAEVRSTYDRS